MNFTDITAAEIKEVKLLTRKLLELTRDVRVRDDFRYIKGLALKANESGLLERDKFGFHPLVMSLSTAISLSEEFGADRNMIMAIMLYKLLPSDEEGAGQTIPDDQDGDIAHLIAGLSKVSSLYHKHGAVASENFRNLMLTFAEDIRVIIIMIVDRLVLMRAINHHPEEKMVKDTAMEAVYLYTPLAHRLGLYKIKSALEDMSLKYTNRDMYTRIARKLNDTKKNRDAYIDNFIAPVKKALESHGLKFDIKGRTKSIYSIWNKMVKQNNDVDHIYDLFAIRVILDVPVERERAECWLAYSVVTDMYQPNPARLKDWLSIPKSNGYESLHITVMGPMDRWVEVQIRSRRMDEIAEKGIAAHWKYKGIKAENNLDTWMTHVRDILEEGGAGPMALMRNLKMDLYNEEVFVFTPKGDLYKLPVGATVLDFAFNIHSKLGCTCIGGKVNGKSKKLNYKLKSGDTVEVLTSSNQVPKLDWLSMVVTSKARNKIRQTINELNNKSAELAKEMLQRRFRNRKIDPDEGVLMKVIKKSGYKTVTEFYNAISKEEIDVNDIISEYENLEQKEEISAMERTSAQEFTLQSPVSEAESANSEVLVIGDNVKGLSYKFAKCCNPIYGDRVFGFISSEGTVKIHREDCPNARNIHDRFPYRVIHTKWSGRVGGQFGATLRIVGTDDIGIVTNITSIINKQPDASLRSITIDSHDGIFQGFLGVGVLNTSTLNSLIKKIKTVKGVKDVQRNN